MINYLPTFRDIPLFLIIFIYSKLKVDDVTEINCDNNSQCKMIVSYLICNTIENLSLNGFLLTLCFNAF